MTHSRVNIVPGLTYCAASDQLIFFKEVANHDMIRVDGSLDLFQYHGEPRVLGLQLNGWSNIIRYHIAHPLFLKSTYKTIALVQVLATASRLGTKSSELLGFSAGEASVLQHGYAKALAFAQDLTIDIGKRHRPPLG